MSGSTGIKVSFDLTEGNSLLGDLLEALHLESVMAAILRETRTLVVTLDGVRNELEVDREHYLECVAGEHNIAIGLGDWLGDGSFTERLTTQSLKVMVEHEKLTEVHFRVEMGTTEFQIVQLHRREPREDE